MPFFVSERVCAADDLDGHSQVAACEVDYERTLVWSFNVPFNIVEYQVNNHFVALLVREYGRKFH